jgi:hypothetical protein
MPTAPSKPKAKRKTKKKRKTRIDKGIPQAAKTPRKPAPITQETGTRDRLPGENPYVWFTEQVCQLPLYDKQRAIITAMGKKNARVAVKAANGSGKTTHICAPLVCAFLAKHKDARVVTTSGVYRQVKEQMWPKIRHLAESRLQVFGASVNQTEMTMTATAGRAIGFSTDDPGKFEGWHAEHLLIIVDEAKSVEDPIYQAIERCIQGSGETRVLLLSSPGGSSGQFWRAFTHETDYWTTFTISAYDCEHINKDEIQKLISRYGEDHPLVRSMVFGEFTDDAGDIFVLSEGKVNDCMSANPVHKDKHEVVVFCDFAAGGDENVIAHRIGNKVHPLTAWVDKDTVRAAGRFAMEIRKIFQGDAPAGCVYGDGSGIGQPFCKMLQGLGIPIVPIHNGSKARKKKEFFNRGSEMWGDGAMMVEKAEVILPNDDDLRSQMTTRKWDRKSYLDKVLRVESKDDMRKRGVRSPDRADAVFGCLTNGPRFAQNLDKFGANPNVLQLMASALPGADSFGNGFDPGL